MSLHSLCKEMRAFRALCKSNREDRTSPSKSHETILLTGGSIFFSLQAVRSLLAPTIAHGTCAPVTLFVDGSEMLAAKLPEVTPKAEKDSNETRGAGSTCPWSLLLKRLNNVILDSLDGSLDPQIRGAAKHSTQFSRHHILFLGGSRLSRI